MVRAFYFGRRDQRFGWHYTVAAVRHSHHYRYKCLSVLEVQTTGDNDSVLQAAAVFAVQSLRD